MPIRWNKEQNIHDAGYWLAKKIDLIKLKDHHITSHISISALRGGIFNVELGLDNIGGEKNKKRPCLIISKNNLNKGDTVVVLPLTRHFNYNIDPLTHEKRPKYSNHYILYKSKYPFLTQDSGIKCEDIKTVDKVRLCEHLGNIDVEDLRRIKKRLLDAFGY